MSVKDDLIAAKALIDTPEKWCKGIHKGQNCTMWAVGDATRQHSGGMRWLDCEVALSRAVPKSFVGPSGVHPIVAFNDAEETSHADIMALFDRAIEGAK